MRQRFSFFGAVLVIFKLQKTQQEKKLPGLRLKHVNYFSWRAAFDFSSSPSSLYLLFLSFIFFFSSLTQSNLEHQDGG